MRTLDTLSPGFITLSLAEVITPCKATDKLLQVLGKMPYLSLSEGPVIAGGSIVRAILGKDAYSDFDLFCSNTQDYDEVLKKLESGGASTDIFQVEDCTLGKDESSMEAGDIFVANYFLGDLEIQVINMDLAGIPGSKPVDILRGFDVVNAMFATDGKNVLFHPDAAISLLTKEVLINNSEHRHKLLAVRPKLDKNASRVAKYEALLNPPEEAA